jgi:hypothetical protein
MHQLNHDRWELRLKDDIKRARKKRSIHKKQKKLNTSEFLSTQDSMGDALSSITTLSRSQRMKLKASIEHAFIYSDLSTLQKTINALGDANCRSIAARIINGCINSHQFRLIDGKLKLTKQAKLEWRKLGLESVAQNFDLTLSHLPITKRKFSAEFHDRFKKLQ